ncbi:hypothetical protein C8A03DRAFT_38487 [Achaetomium macrosporum]|uniref:Chromo domain-containing protein n=1 Tax=Achaetomium macrosporum TaxID=79813 RepID=A0AAN7C1U0_9PEZI|nr:hypothetical protein C8A03DRAFT_38487 [Achaetomium macrosporum]
MATDCQETLIPFAVAGSDRPRLNLLIPKLPSSSVSNTHEFKFKSGAGTGNNVATAHATSGGSRQSQSLRAGRLHCGDVGGTKIPPKDVIVISSDDESSDGEIYDDESYDAKSYNDEPSDNESSDDESSHEQQKSGPGCPLAPSSISPTAPSTKLSQLANGASAACQPGQASTPNHTTRNNTAPATNAASLVKHEAARPDHGCQRDPRPFAEPCETTSKDDISKCLSHDERDKCHFRHDVQDPHRAASRQERETRQKSDGSYRSASHDHHGDGDQTSSSAHRHLPVPDETGEPTKNDPVRLLYVQERRASPSVVPDHQSISEPKPADAELRFQYQSSSSTASKHRVEKQHESGSSALSQHRDHHYDSNQTNDRKQGNSQLPGDRVEQGVGSPFVTSQVQESGASISRSSEAMSNDDRMLADVGPSVQPSASQDRVSLQHSLGRRPRSGTDVGDNHRPIEDGVREHGLGDVTQPPQKRRRISTSTPAIGETAPKRPADPHCASSRLQQTHKPTTRHATPRRSRLKTPKPHSAGVASMTKKPQEEYFNVKRILNFQVRYLVEWEGYGPQHNSWEPVEHFERCPNLLREFHESTGSVGEWIAREFRALRPCSTEAHRSAQ